MIQSLNAATFEKTVGDKGSAHPRAKDTIPRAVPRNTAGPPESP